ncbi:adenosylmethionine--8-amino-7-oxononanoate transaminase [Paramaledivibacter caminithermalis]|uniref:Adenosylmethionine-8-amino-7-oxononanoate aminotransferase n=1 Tax=Paramaledivibacter caminithermalis (strain DSM 15212 / CIP 107654 / DViRD3) TaxID=1121301 RepID=A0A1M6LQA8_PARC5|nr:adenosylmethionine--8-amino-7-oxononanoate transaminase [Paramaledivibacter caminithermalis]SHJ73386.1 adenosylmethionine-8-amino-7-oxononanoate aminotransferase [Paramaledivibacter caminithermalis DSM 15212]
MESLQSKDLKYIWHPCSQMKDYEDFPPIVIDRGEGVFLYDIQGRRYLDAVSSWWVNLFGHSNRRINRAIANQVDKLEHVIFANFSHKPAIELAERMVNIAPRGLTKVFFADNGSSAIEVAIKLSFQYFQQTGKPKKTKFIAITDAYHGETLGALSVGAIDLYSKIYKPLLLNTYKVEGPDCFRCKYGLNRDTCNAQCFEYMERAIEKNHEEIAGAIIEPMVQGAAGMKIYSPVYLKKLREICDRYDIHFIADEIAVGFGRTGKMYACEHAEVSPDIMCVSKGLTAGYLPLSLTLMTDEIYDAFYDEYTTLKAFLHSHSYTGNPIGCAVACETLNIFEDENILEKNKMKSRIIKQKVQEYLMDIPYVGEFRQLGMIGAVELVKDKETKEGFDWKERVGYKIYKNALKHGVLLRPLGNVVYFMPPYVINEEEIDLMIDVARKSVKEYFGII